MNFFLQFLKSRLTLEHFEIKDEFPKFPTPKEVFR